MRLLTKRRVLLFVLAVAVVLAVPLLKTLQENGQRGGQLPAEPFRIAGNFYYVGANDVTLFLITGPEGHVLLDGGYPRTPELIMASIAKLGFNIKDVKVLLNSHAHFDHAGGLLYCNGRQAPSCGPAKRALTSSRPVVWTAICLSRCGF